MMYMNKSAIYLCYRKNKKRNFMEKELNDLEKLLAQQTPIIVDGIVQAKPVIETPEEIEKKRLDAENLAKEAEEKLKAENEEKEKAEVEAKAKLEEEGKKVEEKEAKAEDVLSVLDKLKAPEKKEEPVIQKAEFTPEQLKQLADAQAILGNPVAKAIAEATPDQVKQIAKELAGNDYSKTSYAELLSMKAQKLGLTGTEITEAIEEAMIEFEALGKIAKKERESSLRNEFQSNESESPLLKQLMDQQAEKEKNKQPQPSETEIETLKAKTIEQELGQIDAVGKELLGSEYHGIPIDQATIDAIKAEYDIVQAEKFVDRKTGIFNELEFIKDKLAKVMITKVAETKEKAGELKAKKVSANLEPEAKKQSPGTDVVNPKIEQLKQAGFPTYYTEPVMRND